jgi:hypothetical protein
MRFILFAPRWPHPDQNETGSVRRKNKPPPARSANSTFRLTIILES